MHQSQSANSILLKVAAHIAFILISILLMLHAMPLLSDFNIKIIDQVKFSHDSTPFSMYLNFDKALLGLAIVVYWGLGEGSPFSLKKTLFVSTLCLIPCTMILIGLALASGYIRFDPKLPPQSLVFMANNLLLVCLSEEAFFRRYVQGGLQDLLSKWKMGKTVALLGASILFGLAHFPGGITYIVLSTIAGIFYGLAYQKSGRIEASMLTHFGLNAVHFLLFSYPALAIR